MSDEAPRGLSIFGQEMDNATSALARMNMILHNNATAKIWKGNTIADPQWKENREVLLTTSSSDVVRLVEKNNFPKPQVSRSSG